MKNMRVSLVCICTLFLIACTNQVIYDNAKESIRDEECHNLPSSEAYDQCIERGGKSYGDYERDRQEVLNKNN